MSSDTRPRVFLDVTIDHRQSGKLVIELFTDHVPKTCENFKQLCTGQHEKTSYAGCPFHRIIDEFMVQGGDVTNNDGTGTFSIYGKEFDDENLNWRDLDAAGLVCSANRGKNTNGSQFFITLAPQPHLNGKHTIFGRLVSGQDVLQKMVSVSVDNDDRPNAPVIISRCGELERKRKRQDEMPGNTTNMPSSKDRGRRRESYSSDIDMDAVDVLRQTDTKRRQSDNAVDEGLRGRPRKRSGQRASTSPGSEFSSNQRSPVTMHKRKRSPSPSRHVKDEEQDRPDTQRRRRSLPNQYHDKVDSISSKRHTDHRYSEQRPDYRQDHRRTHERRDRQRSGREQNSDPRAKDRWTPYRSGREHMDSSGRLGDNDSFDDTAPPVKFKGRGIMKYREPDSF